MKKTTKPAKQTKPKTPAKPTKRLSDFFVKPLQTAKPTSNNPNTIYLVLRADYSVQNLEVCCLRFKTLEEAKTMLRDHYKSLKADWTEDDEEYGNSLDISSDAMSLSTVDSQECTATTWTIEEVDLDNPLEN